jgi:hypothetical protein
MWQFDPDRVIYMRGYWWEVVFDYGEWIVWPAFPLNKRPIYGPFATMEYAMYWLEQVFFGPGGEFERRYPNTGE